MQYREATKLTMATGLTGTMLVLLALAMLTFAPVIFVPHDAKATPALAKGKPCSACHSGSPPSKRNAK